MSKLTTAQIKLNIENYKKFTKKFEIARAMRKRVEIQESRHKEKLIDILKSMDIDDMCEFYELKNEERVIDDPDRL